MDITQDIQELRSHFNELIHLVGVDSLKELNKESIPAIIASDVLQLLYNMDSVGARINNALQAEIDAGDFRNHDEALIESDPELAGWYKTDYKPHAKKVENLIAFLTRGRA